MKVYLSPSAGEQVHQLIDYLEAKWSDKVRDNFIAKFEYSLEILSIMPYSFPKTHSFPAIRKCLITSQTTAFYRIDEIRKEVEIIAVLDNRQEFKL